MVNVMIRAGTRGICSLSHTSPRGGHGCARRLCQL